MRDEQRQTKRERRT